MVPRSSLRLMRKQQQQQYRHKYSYITESRKRLHGTWFTLWPTYDTRWTLTTTFTLKSPIQRLLATATQLSPVAESAVSRTLESGVDSWTGLRTHLTTGLDCGRGLFISHELHPIREWTGHMSVIAAVTCYHGCSTKMDVAQVWFAQHSKIKTHAETSLVKRFIAFEVGLVMPWPVQWGV